MSGYIENEIVEANRLRSQEALSGNNENPAQWTNTLSNIYELNAGDKVSMYSGFISERGAGSLKTIELKGKSLGKKKKFTYITEDTTYEPISKIPLWSVVTQVIDEEIELKDNEANLILNYYKNTNGTGYIGLPRMGADFTPVAQAEGVPDTTALPSIPYNVADGSTSGYISPIPSFDFMIKNDYQVCVYNALTDRCVKVKNDNTKFTLFISQYSLLNYVDGEGWTINGGFDNANEPVDNWTIAPEYRHYYVYRQKLPIKVDKGFNSAQFIADDLTKKLQGVISERKQIYRQNMNEKETANGTIDKVVNKIIESETYKTFNCATQGYWDPDDVANLGDGSTETTWYNNYQIIGWKRPELYETGQYVNMNASNDGTKLTITQDRLLGSSLRQKYDKNVNEPLRTNIPYTKDNLLKLKAFIDSQSLYPEIWESWNDDDDTPFDTKAQVTYGTPKSATENFDYNHTHTIDTTRFFHMNTIQNINMVEIDIDYLAVDSAVQYSHTTLKSAYDSGFLLIDLYWDGQPNTLFNPSTGTGDPVGEYYYLCSAIVNIGGVDETVVIQEADGDPIANTQTLVLASGFSTALSVDTPVTIKYITVSSQVNVLKNRSSLGSSLYRPTHADPSRTNDHLRYSKLFLVYYNPDDKDTYYDEPDIDKNKLTYGCFTKEEFTYTNTLDGGATITADFINIHPSVRIDKGQSIDLDLAHWLDGLNLGFLEVGRKFGYDLHFTACCNPAIVLYNGKEVPINYYGESIINGITSPIYGDTDNNTNATRTGGGEGGGMSEFVSRRYIGADNPSFIWDGEHFGISDLHTGENLAGRSADGGRYIANPVKLGGEDHSHLYITSGIPDDSGDPVYIINPFQNLDEFCPAIVPYLEQRKVIARDSTGYNLNEFNLNYIPFTVYDSKSGIFLEDMGYDQDTWDDGLWGIMGFSYEQFNGDNNTRILRVDNTNIKTLKYPTTNADIKVTNTKNWDTNENGKPHFSDNVPTPFSMYDYAVGTNPPAGRFLDKYIQIYPNINVKTSSIQLRAENFPTSMIKGYYTIRSDIVPQSVFVGGRSNITNMPIVGTITKENPQADYFFAGESNIEFTIGKPTKLSSITVSIHDPDGSYANVNNSSSVLFKIQRQMNVSFNVIGDILQKKNTKKSKL